jgi:hypothetical protein
MPFSQIILNSIIRGSQLGLLALGVTMIFAVLRFAPIPPIILSVAWAEMSRVIQKQAYELGLFETVKDTWYPENPDIPELRVQKRKSRGLRR